MKQRGRKSAAALVVVPDVGPPTVRLAPPETLTDAQRAIWHKTVNAMPADWFGPQHTPLLEAYCRHLAFAGTIARAINQVRPESLLDAEGLRRHDKLYAMHDREMR